MGIILRQSSISTILLYVGSVIGYLNVTIVMPWVLSLEQIGLYRVIYAIAAIIAPIANFGVNSSTTKFFPSFEKDNLQGAFYGIRIILMFFGTLLSIGIFLLFQDEFIHFFNQKSSEVNQYISLIIPLWILIALVGSLESQAKVNFNVTITVLLRDVLLRVLTLSALILFGLQVIPFEYVLYSWHLIFVIIFVILVIYISRNEIMKVSFHLAKVSLQKIKEVFVFSSLSVLTGIASQTILIVDQIMISGMLGLEKNGIYTISFFIGTFIEFPRRSLVMISTPFLTRYFNEGDIPSVKSLYKKISINQMAVGGFLFTAVIINLEEIFLIIPNGESYLSGSKVVFFIALGKLIDMTFSANNELIILSKYYKVNLVLIPLFALIVVVSNLLLIPILGIEGAAMGSALSYLGYNLMKFFFIKLKFKFSPFSKNNIVLGFMLLFFLAIGFSTPLLFNPYSSILIKASIFAFSYFYLLRLLKVSDDINMLIDKAKDSILGLVSK